MPKADRHGTMVRAAIDAINTVFADTSVSRERTKASMIEIREIVAANLDALEDVETDEDDS